jgi:hypothetical protein
MKSVFSFAFHNKNWCTIIPTHEKSGTGIVQRLKNIATVRNLRLCPTRFESTAYSMERNILRSVNIMNHVVINGNFLYRISYWPGSTPSDTSFSFVVYLHNNLKSSIWDGRLLNANRLFWGTCLFDLQGWRKGGETSKKPPCTWRLAINGLHVVISQKIVFFIATVARTEILNNKILFISVSTTSVETITYLLTELSPSWEAANRAAIHEIPSNFKEPEGSSPCSQWPSTGPYSEPVRSSPYHPILSV